MRCINLDMVQTSSASSSEVVRTDRLGDRKCCAEGNELYRDEEKDARLAHAAEWLVVQCHLAIREEVEDFSGDAVPRELIEAHVPAYEAKSDHQRPS